MKILMSSINSVFQVQILMVVYDYWRLLFIICEYFMIIDSYSYLILLFDVSVVYINGGSSALFFGKYLEN